MLKGFIDIQKETERLNAKREKIEGPLLKLKASTEANDYNEKVPEEVRAANSERLRQMNVELCKVSEALKALSLIE